MALPIILIPLLKWAIGGAVVAYTAHQTNKAIQSHYGSKNKKTDADAKNAENASKGLEANNKLLKEMNDKMQKELNGLKNAENELNRAKNTINDPNASEKEKEEARKKIPLLQAQIDEYNKNISFYRGEIKRLGNENKELGKIIASGGSNTNWIKELITVENVLVIGGCYIVYKLLKDDKDK